MTVNKRYSAIMNIINIKSLDISDKTKDFLINKKNNN